MSKVPFYADADSLSRTDSGRREAAIFIFYIGLIAISTMALMFGDMSDLLWVKTMMAISLIGLPLILMNHLRKAVETHADELLKAEYYAVAARSCGSIITLVLIWILWGRWFDNSQLAAPGNVANLAITVLPYMTILFIYTNVRRKMITLSGDAK